MRFSHHCRKTESKVITAPEQSNYKRNLNTSFSQPWTDGIREVVYSFLQTFEEQINLKTIKVVTLKKGWRDTN